MPASTLQVSYTPSLALAVRAVHVRSEQPRRWQLDTSEYFRQIGRNLHASRWAELWVRAAQIARWSDR
jgi:hypothetical protein